MPETREIPGWPGYWASDDGSIYSSRTRGKSRGGWRKMRPGFVGKYLSVMLCAGTGTEPTRVYVHDLILLAFVGPKPDGMESMHDNDIQTDNRSSNLKYGTHLQNCRQRVANGKQSRGESRPLSKLTDESVRFIRVQLKAGKSQAELARRLKVSVSVVNDVKLGKSWTHVA